MNPIVIKLGGAAGVDAEAVCADVAALAAEGRPVVLVHGTSAAADALAARTGTPVRHLTSPSGHVSRYTDPEMLELYVAAAAGQVNKRLVADLQRLGCNAVGLSGVDGRLLVARRKNAVRAVENGRQRIVRDDYTGQLETANGELLRLLLGAGYTPVVAPLALGTEGERLNVDGDRAAALLAAHAGRGDADHPQQRARPAGRASRTRPAWCATSRRTQLDAAEAMAQGRMKKKVLAAREALAGGVPQVILGRFAAAPADPRRAGGRGHVLRHPGRRAGRGAGALAAVHPSPSAGEGRLMNQQEIMALESAHTSGVYPKRPLAIVRGQGARVWDADGNEYIDCVGGQGAANLGHAHPAIVAAITAAGGAAHHLPGDLLQRPPRRAAGRADRASRRPA